MKAFIHILHFFIFNFPVITVEPNKSIQRPTANGKYEKFVFPHRRGLTLVATYCMPMLVGEAFYICWCAIQPSNGKKAKYKITIDILYFLVKRDFNI